MIKKAFPNIFFLFVSLLWVGITAKANPVVGEQPFFAVIRVPEDYPTIQEAVNAANNDDVIILSQGTYALTETVIINKRLTLASEYINSESQEDVDNTIITGPDNLDPLILFNTNTTGSSCTGITFRGARKQLTLECEYMEVTHCAFFDNGSDALSIEAGGGYFAYNYFENNGDEAIDADDSLDWIVEHNTIINSGDDGLEIRLQNNTGLARTHIIRYNYISGADEDGIQLIDYDGDSGREFFIHHNVIVNSAMVGLGCTQGGNTVENFEGSIMEEPAYVHNNVFSDNDHGITGGENMLVFNNIIINSSTVGIKKLDAGSTADYNCLFNNGTDFLNADFGPNNIFQDPMAKTDFSLEDNSPCIDTGTKTFSFNGLSHAVDDEDISGDLPDRGAKEYHDGATTENLAPIVSAGPDLVIEAPDNTVTLLGEVTDDGLPLDENLTISWSVENGPVNGDVNFANTDQAVTEATFFKQGNYFLGLAAGDGEKASSDRVEVFYVNDYNDIRVDIPESKFIEAENYRYLVGNAAVMSNATASGGQIVSADNLSNEEVYAYSEYELVTFAPGTYYVWINASGPDVGSNGLAVAFNDLVRQINIEVNTNNSFGSDGWTRVVFENIPEGVYPLRISALEQGVSWDRIFITMDENETPLGEKEDIAIIYPVPSNGSFTIVLNDLQPAEIEVFNILGQKVYTTSVENRISVFMNMGFLGKGVYVVRISKNGTETEKKIIIK